MAKTLLLFFAFLPLIWAELNPLARQVTIRRDTYGVPHILAETEEAAAYGMGWAQAEDHAVEIARRFISARGESAQYFGAAGVDADFEVRRYRNHSFAMESFSKLSPLMQSMLKAYAAAYNDYVALNRNQLPDWIPAFTGVDVFAQGRAEIMRFAFSRARQSIQSVQRKYGASPSPWQDDGLGGSNMWALAPKRTKSGKSILLGNPHQSWAALYWEAHVTVPGKLNMFGGTFVGRPLLTTGFNETLGWTHTVNLPDLDDIYVLELDKEKPHHYLHDGKSMALASREISVPVRGGQPQTRTYWSSHLGSIVHRTSEKVFAIKSAILDAYGYYEQWYDLGKARNWKQFRAILERNHLPMFNLAYADADGNIFYLWNGTVPKRVDDGTDYRAEVPGATSRHIWTAFHPTADLPQLLNPSSGYVQNCNDPPWWTSLRDRLDPKRFPSYFEPGRTLGLRTQISLQMLESSDKFSLDDVMRLKNNTRMLLADRVKPGLVKALQDVHHPGATLMEAWDNSTNSTSRGAVLFQRFWDLYREAAKPEPFAIAWDAKNPARTPSGIANPQLAVQKFDEAMQQITKSYGDPAVAWGDVHRYRIAGQDLPASGAPGEYGVFRVMGYRDDKDGKRVATGGDGWVMAVELTRPPRAFSILAYGQTSNPASKHSADQIALFAGHGFKPVWFTESDIQANLARSYRPGQ
jgi:acyl-homoserine-lactone acylase